jgi:hypothetical protein
MIETIYLEIIILTVLIWAFESKFIPQMIIMFLTLAMLLNEIATVSNLRAQIGVVLLFATVFIYAGLSIYSQKSLED